MDEIVRKPDLMRRVHDKCVYGYPKTVSHKDVEFICNAFLEAIAESLGRHERVAITSMFTLTVTPNNRKVDSKKVFGEVMQCKAYNNRVSMRVSSKLKELVNL